MNDEEKRIKEAFVKIIDEHLQESDVDPRAFMKDWDKLVEDMAIDLVDALVPLGILPMKIPKEVEE